MIMKATLKDLLHAINILGDDRDVFVDGNDTIAVCPPVKFTPEGLEYWRKALGAAVEVEYKDDTHRDTYVSDDREAINEKAWNLLNALAGYCSESKFNKWFEGDTAKMI